MEIKYVSLKDFFIIKQKTEGKNLEILLVESFRQCKYRVFTESSKVTKNLRAFINLLSVILLRIKKSKLFRKINTNLKRKNSRKSCRAIRNILISETHI